MDTNLEEDPLQYDCHMEVVGYPQDEIEQQVGHESLSQPLLLETQDSEEIVVSELNEEHFTVYNPELTMQANTDAIDSSVPSISDSIVDFQEMKSVSNEPMQISLLAKQANQTVKLAPAPKKGIELAPVPQHMAIAPKIPGLKGPLQIMSSKPIQKKLTLSKNIPIAPKLPINLIPNKNIKKISLANVVTSKSQVINQMGELVIPSGAQKMKLVSEGGVTYLTPADSSGDKVQLISSPRFKPLFTKVVLPTATDISQPTDPSNQPAVITKLGLNNLQQPQRVVSMQTKTVPVSKQVVLASPKPKSRKTQATTSTSQLTAQTITITADDEGQPMDSSNQPAVITKLGMSNPQQPQRIVTMQTKTVPVSKQMVLTSPKSKVRRTQVTTMTSQSTPQTITLTGQSQGLTLANRKKVVLASSSGGILMPQDGQRTLHQVNIPGKGLQYVLVPASGAQQPGKTIVFSDSRGQLVQIKDPASISLPAKQPGNKAVPVKLVKVSHVGMKSLQGGNMPPLTVVSRPSQSLLVPLDSQKQQTQAQPQLISMQPLETSEVSQDEPQSNVHMEEISEFVICDTEANIQDVEMVEMDQSVESQDSIDIEAVDGNASHIETKTAPRSLLVDAVDGQDLSGVQSFTPANINNIKIEYEVAQNSMEPTEYNENSMDMSHNSQQYSLEDSLNESRRKSKLLDVNIEVEVSNADRSSPSFSNPVEGETSSDFGLKPRKGCNCTKSQCLKLYCDCFANGEFCYGCNCHNCNNNLSHEELRQKAIRGCLERNPHAFRPKIGKSKEGGPEIIRRHYYGCNCKRSGCLKNYCECYEAKIACSSSCKCVGCRNSEDEPRRELAPPLRIRQPSNLMTSDVVRAVCQCLLAAAGEGGKKGVLEEFGRCLGDIVRAANQARQEAGA